MAIDWEERYREYLDECYDEIRFGELSYAPSTVLERTDPVAFRCGVSDFTPDATAWQSDTFGTRCNLLFLARFADEQGITCPDEDTWETLMHESYNPHRDMEPDAIREEIESELSEHGFETDWDNGVYIYER